MPVFTIFTPTYNRAHTLPRLYASIRRQTFRDFEWLIVDDGSTDGTEALVRQWQAEGNDFPIRYYWQPNQHKKVAFNRGVKEAKGQWFVPIDSDDELLSDALQNVQKMWASIPNDRLDHYCAVVGLCVDDRGVIIGDQFPNAPLDASAVELWFDCRITGDKCLALRTEALRQYPFPEEIPDLVPEGVVWFRMARHYRQRCFNVPLLVIHFDTESLTRPSDPVAVRLQRAEGALLSNAEALDHITVRRLLRSPLRAMFLAVQYGRSASYLPPPRRRYRPQSGIGQALVRLFWPLGWCLYRCDNARLTERLRDGMMRLGIRFY